MPEYATTHGDSFFFDAAIMIVVASYIESPTRRAFWRMALVSFYMLVVIVMNNRRLAFVGIGGGLVAMLLWLPESPANTIVQRVGLRAAPFLIANVALGQGSISPYFEPARIELSVLAQADT